MAIGGAAPASVRIRVPATSANLGPGFDSFGLALALHDDVSVRVRETGLSVEVSGEGEREVPRDGGHLLVRAMHAAFDAMDAHRPGLAVTCLNRIPHGRGLGSSAAAIVAGVLAARALVPGGELRLDDAGVLDLCSTMEGHPDNVAACLRGGFTVAWCDGAGARSARLEPVATVVAVAYVPLLAVTTAHTRSLLPASVPHGDAAHAVGRAGLLVAALTARPDLLLAATEDRLHQAYRTPAMPRTAALVDSLRARGVPAVVSGAGPSVLALTEPARAVRLAAEAPEGFAAHVLALERSGAAVQVDPLPVGGSRSTT